MSLSGLLLRFAGIYVALLALLALGFGLAGAPTSGVNIGALFGAVVGACLWFANRNKRFLEPREKKAAVLGMWGIDIGLQVLVTLAVGAATGPSVRLDAMLVSMGIVAVVRGLFIYIFVGVAGKQYAKQLARGG